MSKSSNNFEFVRLVAATMVILGHSYNLTGTGSGPIWYDTGVSAFAVRIFFVLSGYLICQSWRSDPNLFRFALKRGLRILPALGCVVVLSACVVGPILTTLPLHDYFNDRSFYLYFWNIGLAPYFVLPGVFEHNGSFIAVNGSLWTLPMEVAMYAALPIYASRAFASRRFLLPLAAIASVATSVYFEVIEPTQVQPVIYWTSIPFTLKLAPYFIIGAVMQACRLERFLNLQVALILVGLLPCLSGAQVAYHAFLIVFVPYITLSFALAEAPLFSALNIKRDISYGVYLWAFPIQQTLISVSHNALSPVALFVVATALTYGVAYLSARFVEEPAMRLKPRQQFKERSTLSVPAEASATAWISG